VNKNYKPGNVININDKFGRYSFSILKIDRLPKNLYLERDSKNCKQVNRFYQVARIVNKYYKRTGKLLSYNTIAKIYKMDFYKKPVYSGKYIDMYWQKLKNPVFILDNTPVYF